MGYDIEIVTATDDDIPEVARLFDAYRVWYGTSSDLGGARNFLAQRLRNDESVIFLARKGSEAAGFTQLYPMFSSVSMESTWVLNDLFVEERFRRAGIGTVLLETAAEFARQTGALRLNLQTETANLGAQRAYEKHGWMKDDEFIYYSLPVTSTELEK